MKREWLIIALILLTASVFRFQHIVSAPPGLYPDEAINGNDATRALETGRFRVFYPDNNGREGLFMNLQAISLAVFGHHAWALRIVSAIAGVLTVWGLYLLARSLFNRQIAALSSFLLAVSFWHVVFSRIGFRAILAPLFLVWAFYFLWRGLSSAKYLPFALSGIFWGLGAYTYIAFRAMPLALAIVLFSYWFSVRMDFGHDKYLHTRHHLAKGLVVLLLAAIFVSLPIGIYFYFNRADFFGRTAQVSIFGDKNLVWSFVVNSVKTLGSFNFVGDFNWRHNFSGQPLLLWSTGALFLVGFFRSWLKLFGKLKGHGHFSTVQVLLLSWFFVGLLPVVFSSEGLPHALRLVLVAPVVFIFAGEGLWWFYRKLDDWYHLANPGIGRKNLAVPLALVLFLAAITVFNYDKYFNRWAQNPNVAGAFNQNYVDLGNELNKMPASVKKYVLVNAGGVLVNGISMPAQTVMFITDTASPEKQKARNLFYLTQEQFEKGEYDRQSIVIPLEK